MKVDPERYLEHPRVAHHQPALTCEGVGPVNIAPLDPIAYATIRGNMRTAVAEGGGLGIGGTVTIIPDLGILPAITIGTSQELNLIYGFQSRTYLAELWVAAAPPTEPSIRPGAKKPKSITARRDP